jgi:HD-GYP domain-containing protein (c-di-GMP phosphodiesterase class II)
LGIIRKGVSVSSEEYHRFPIEMVSDQTEVPVDLYILFGKDHYVKIYMGYDNLLEVYDKYFNKKVEFFYVLKPFLEELRSYIRSSHRSSELMEMDPKDIAGKLKLDPDDIKEVNKTFHNSFKVIKNSDNKLNSIIESISEENKYQRKSIILTSYLAVSVVKTMPWFKENMIEKLVFACIFHDLLVGKEKLAKILDKGEINSNVLSWQEIKIIKEHGHVISEKIDKIPHIPSDVIHILRNHHELPDGGGFPRGISNDRIRPLTGLFIICEFASHFLLTESLVNIESLLVSLEKKFMEYSNFTKATKQLIKLLQSEE